MRKGPNLKSIVDGQNWPIPLVMIIKCVSLSTWVHQMGDEEMMVLHRQVVVVSVVSYQIWAPVPTVPPQATGYSITAITSVCFSFQQTYWEIMFSQSKNRYRDESAVHKWDQLKQYEDNLESNPHQDFRSNTSSEQSNTLSVIKTFKQLKESGTKTYSSIKTHVTDMYRYL